MFSLLFTPLKGNNEASPTASTSVAAVYTQADYLRALGWALSVQGQIRQLGLNEAELEQVVMGLRYSMRDGAIPECLSSPGFHEFFTNKSKDLYRNP